MIHSDNKQTGFTTVELLVTILTATIFTIILYQLFIVANMAMDATKKRAIASELAYSYIGRYNTADNLPTNWFVCDTATGSANTNDFTKNQAAAGQTLVSGTLTNTPGLPRTTTYKVTAVATYGCSGGNAGSPILLEASVTYGSPAQTVKHATMVSY